MNIGRKCDSGSSLVALIGLIEQEICCQLLVLIASEVRLDDLISLEAKTT